jgi:Reverse transcriptase (RNA-dependent DNA polymerase)
VKGTGLLPVNHTAHTCQHFLETAVVAAHNDLVCAVDNERLTALVMLDLGMAFNAVDHTALLHVLEKI